MKIFIVTPSFNQVDWLKLCIASVADQVTASSTCSGTANLSSQNGSLVVHHHVQDGASIDGTKDFLCEYASEIEKRKQSKGLDNYHFSFESSPDCGMYDAINRGWGYADDTADVVAYLNCDEQYLPKTLTCINEYFTVQSKIDIVFGDALLVRPDGTLVSFRKGYVPRWQYIATSHLYVLSCTMFLRKPIIDANLLFDSNLKTIGDADLVTRILKAGYKASHIKRFLSTFTLTGNNLGKSETAVTEAHIASITTPWYFRCLGPLFNISRLIEKTISGAYFQQAPIRYSIFTDVGITHRKAFIVEKASFRWPTK